MPEWTPERTRGRTSPPKRRFLPADACAGEGWERMHESVAVDAVAKVGRIEIGRRSSARHHQPDRQYAQREQVGWSGLERECRAQDGGTDRADGIGRHVRMGEPRGRLSIPKRHSLGRIDAVILRYDLCLKICPSQPRSNTGRSSR